MWVDFGMPFVRIFSCASTSLLPSTRFTAVDQLVKLGKSGIPMIVEKGLLGVHHRIAVL